MRVFEQFFVNFEMFETDNLNKEYLYLTQLKFNALNSEEKNNIKRDEDEDEKENKKGVRFQLRDEEDIDEDNKSLDSNELNNQIITTSKKHRNKFIDINNNIDNDDNDNENSINIIDNSNNNNDNDNSDNYSYNPNQDLIIGNKNNLILKKANESIKKIFGTNLV